MRVTFHGHACAAVRHGSTTVVVDPGSFSDAATALRGADVVLVTHDHPDHVEVPVLVDALAVSPTLVVHAPADLAARLRHLMPDAAASRIRAVAPGDVLELGGLRVSVGGGQHAMIHPDVPRIANVTYLLEADGASVHHPGDSFELPAAVALGGRRLDVLLAPVSGPWMKLSETIDAIRALDPQVVVPIHEALLSATGLGLVDRLLGEGRTGGSYDYRRLAPGEFLELEHGGGAPVDHPEYAEVALLEDDETVPPRPEEDIADAGRG